MTPYSSYVLIALCLYFTYSYAFNTEPLCGESSSNVTSHTLRFLQTLKNVRWIHTSYITSKEHHIFELNNPGFCPSSISAGAVAMIVIFTIIGLFSLYFLIGGLVNYTVKGRRGVAVLPNTNIWCGCIQYAMEGFKITRAPHGYSLAPDTMTYSSMVIAEDEENNESVVVLRDVDCNPSKFTFLPQKESPVSFEEMDDDLLLI